MTICDWRGMPASGITPLYAVERSRWQERLAWDPDATWRVVESARASGQLPGFVLRDGRGTIQGWTFFLVHGDNLQIGALAAREARGVRQLLEAVLAAPETALAQRVSAFLLPEGSALVAALERRRFAVRQHPYLSLDLAGVAHASVDPAIRAFGPDDEPGGVRLLAAAYRGASSEECFAPRGRVEEWAWYLRQLLRTPSCGTVIPEASFVADGPGERPSALVITTNIAPGVGHIAQLAVSPRAQGHGLGRRLLDAAIARLREDGYHTLTLMVAADNTPARRLYEARGFSAGPSFIYASRAMPSRLQRAS